MLELASLIPRRPTTWLNPSPWLSLAWSVAFRRFTRGDCSSIFRLFFGRFAIYFGQFLKDGLLMSRYDSSDEYLFIEDLFRMHEIVQKCNSFCKYVYIVCR